jgi:nickel-type superoxide dismutase maturation protease
MRYPHLFTKQVSRSTTRYMAGRAKRGSARLVFCAQAPVSTTPVSTTPVSTTPVFTTPVFMALVFTALVSTALFLVVVTAWRRIQRAEVHGASMVPALLPGDRVVVWKGTTRVRAGDIVAATDPRQPQREVLKRVTAVGPEGVTLLGDNAEESTDSREFGPVPLGRVRGRAVYRYYPPQRAGWLS